MLCCTTALAEDDGFCPPIPKCLPAPPSPSSEAFLWEGTISCQCGEDKKGIQQGTISLGTKGAALKVVDSKRVTTTVSPQQPRLWRSEEGFKCKREEEQCSPRIPCSSKPKAILMRNAFPRQAQRVCSREVHILSPTKFHGAFHGA